MVCILLMYNTNNMKFCIEIFLCVFLKINAVHSTWMLDVEPDIKPCMPDNQFNLIDVSNFKLIDKSDGKKVYVNGTLKFLQEASGIISINFTTEHLKNGIWMPGDFHYYRADACAYINDPMGQPLIYMIVQKAMKQKRCPFKSGHTETFDMYSLTDTPFMIPPQYIGEWRAYSRLYKNDKLIECFKVQFEVV
uniref:CSON010983 protein n=1 Tax=Culicoides sonorensis TaxID=179676 RepID=A0A336LL89_CULSO